MSSNRQSQHSSVSVFLLQALPPLFLLPCGLPLFRLVTLVAPLGHAWDTTLSVLTFGILSTLSICHGGGIFWGVRRARVCALSGISSHVSFVPMSCVNLVNLRLSLHPFVIPKSLSCCHGGRVLWGPRTGTVFWVHFIPLAFSLKIFRKFIYRFKVKKLNWQYMFGALT